MATEEAVELEEKRQKAVVGIEKRKEKSMEGEVGADFQDKDGENCCGQTKCRGFTMYECAVYCHLLMT